MALIPGLATADPIAPIADPNAANNTLSLQNSLTGFFNTVLNNVAGQMVTPAQQTMPAPAVQTVAVSGNANMWMIVGAVAIVAAVLIWKK